MEAIPIALDKPVFAADSEAELSHAVSSKQWVHSTTPSRRGLSPVLPTFKKNYLLPTSSRRLQLPVTAEVLVVKSLDQIHVQREIDEKVHNFTSYASWFEAEGQWLWEKIANRDTGVDYMEFLEDEVERTPLSLCGCFFNKVKHPSMTQCEPEHTYACTVTVHVKWNGYIDTVENSQPKQGWMSYNTQLDSSEDDDGVPTTQRQALKRELPWRTIPEADVPACVEAKHAAKLSSERRTTSHYLEFLSGDWLHSLDPCLFLRVADVTGEDGEGQQQVVALFGVHMVTTLKDWEAETVDPLRTAFTWVGDWEKDNFVFAGRRITKLSATWDQQHYAKEVTTTKTQKPKGHRFDV
eukprot:s119_g44.t1